MGAREATEGAMQRIGLAETVAAVRSELAEAVRRGAGEDIQFPVGDITLQFQIGVTKSAEGTAGVNVWVLELGGTGTYARESVQTVTVALRAPVDADGNPVKVGSSGWHSKPE
jgi:hypothetical protein